MELHLFSAQSNAAQSQASHLGDVEPEIPDGIVDFRIEFDYSDPTSAQEG